MNRIEILKDIWSGFDFTALRSLLISVVPSLLCISFHEFSHAFVAHKLGDDTAKNIGRMTINPIKHIDVVGLLMLMVAHVGWAKPVPIRMSNFKNPKRGMAISSLAGPVSNLLLGIFFIALYGFLFVPSQSSSFLDLMEEMLLVGTYMNIGLAIFNFLPVPPLDGSKVLFSFLKDSSYSWLMKYERYGSIVLLLLVFSGLLQTPLQKAISAVFQLYIPIANLFYKLSILLF